MQDKLICSIRVGSPLVHSAPIEFINRIPRKKARTTSLRVHLTRAVTNVDALGNIDPDNAIAKDEVKDEDETRFVASADSEDGPAKLGFLDDFQNRAEENPRTRDHTPKLRHGNRKCKLTLFHAKAEELSDEYLQKKEVKLGKGRKRSVASDYAPRLLFARAKRIAIRSM